MQPDHETDDLPTLLDEAYNAPPLDGEFSTELIGRLRAEVSSPPKVTRKKSGPSRLAVCLGATTVAALILACIWVANSGVLGTRHELIHRAKGEAEQQTRTDEGTETEEQRTSFSILNEHAINERLINSSESEGSKAESLTPEPASLTNESEGIRNESEFARNESEFRSPTNEHIDKMSALDEFNRAESLAQLRSLAQENQYSELSIVPNQSKKRIISAAVALADRLYVADSGHLFEVNPS